MRRLLVLAALLFAVPAHAVTIDWVEIGDPGNACDTQSEGCFGSVAHVYRIGKYEVTNAQYAEFLNAVADTDTYGLYNTDMGSGYGGITRSGDSGSYTYSAIAGRESTPVNYVSFWDGLRFANWLHNGQPSGLQVSATTEDGAYTVDGYTGWDGSWIDRNAGATIFLPSEDEWYKAAYFNGTSYFDYPAGTDVQTTCAVPGATPNTANCYGSDLQNVGSYTGSASPYGTFDQGGNVYEWSDTKKHGQRINRGGSFYDTWANPLAAFYRPSGEGAGEYSYIGFRVAMIPEPNTALLLACGLVGLAAVRRRRSPH